jgi:hypothetical protein
VVVYTVAIVVNLLPFNEVGHKFLGLTVPQLIESAVEGLIITLGEIGYLIAREDVLVTVSCRCEKAKLILNHCLIIFFFSNQVQVLFLKFSLDCEYLGLKTNGNV